MVRKDKFSWSRSFSSRRAASSQRASARSSGWRRWWPPAKLAGAVCSRWAGRRGSEAARGSGESIVDNHRKLRTATPGLKIHICVTNTCYMFTCTTCTCIGHAYALVSVGGYLPQIHRAHRHPPLRADSAWIIKLAVYRGTTTTTPELAVLGHVTLAWSAGSLSSLEAPSWQK